MWISPYIPSRSTNAPKSTMFEIVPVTTSPGLRPSRMRWRSALRSSSSTARRDSTTLLRERLSSITLQRSSWPRNSSRSWTRRMSTSDAGRNPRTPRSRISPPFTTSITRPFTGSPHSAARPLPLHPLSHRARDRLPRHLEARALLRQDQPPLGVLLRQDERVDLIAERDLVRRVDRAPDRELGDGDDALGLVADVDEDLVLVDAHDGAVHHLPLIDRREGRLVVRDQLAVGAGRPDAVAGGPRVGLFHRQSADHSTHRSPVSRTRGYDDLGGVSGSLPLPTRLAEPLTSASRRAGARRFSGRGGGAALRGRPRVRLVLAR